MSDRIRLSDIQYGLFPKTKILGKRFFVLSNSNANYGDLSAILKADADGEVRLFTSIDAAVGACTANRGDEIYVLPGHTETLSTSGGIALDVAGISIIGMGQGSNRPTITVDTLATAKILVSAANITVQNIIFVSNKADVATLFLLSTAPEFCVQDCEFRDTSSILNFLTIITTTVSVNADGLVFRRNKVMGLATTAATTPIKLIGDMDRIEVTDNFVKLAILNNTSALIAHAALVVTNLLVARNIIFRLNTDTATGAILITTSSTTNTGIVCDNYVKCADAAAIILVTAGSIYGCFQNFVSGAADTSGFLLPAADTDS